jgi:hypothetical protein
MMPRAVVIVGLVVALALGLTAFWVRTWPLRPLNDENRPATSKMEGLRTSASATPTPPPFRLAGVASGGDGSYAAIEDGGGVTGLYRIGDEIPGLGRLAGIASGEVLIDTETGPITIQLQPGPTPTPAATATATLAVPLPSPRSSRGRTAPESQP